MAWEVLSRRSPASGSSTSCWGGFAWRSPASRRKKRNVRTILACRANDPGVDDIDRDALSGAGHWDCAGHLSQAGQRQPDRNEWEGDRFRADRAEVFEAEILPGTAFSR